MCAQRLAALAPDVQPPPELEAATLNHLHLRVNDLDVSQRFYEQHFGWEPIYEVPSKPLAATQKKSRGSEQFRRLRFMRDHRGFLLVLELHPDKSPMPSWFHLGFQLSAQEAVLRAAAYFKKQGITLVGPLRDSPGYTTFAVEDPDGYALQIFWDAENPEAAPD
ncbi:VOC family protein [Rhizobium laguerreae]|uniref:VOC family protein n=1 Tax=Rhizobium laguerreae TaxID=1076926 RepID=UPI001C923310|nr:VOC family protein [Rhizobium laguerreae]MBY3557346.1 VOC family protein [Rhizobium laguerreae]